jgi:hypothetical protein
MSIKAILAPKATGTGNRVIQDRQPWHVRTRKSQQYMKTAEKTIRVVTRRLVGGGYEVIDTDKATDTKHSTSAHATRVWKQFQSAYVYPPRSLN